MPEHSERKKVLNFDATRPPGERGNAPRDPSQEATVFDISDIQRREREEKYLQVKRAERTLVQRLGRQGYAEAISREREADVERVLGEHASEEEKTLHRRHYDTEELSIAAVAELSAEDLQLPLRERIEKFQTIYRKIKKEKGAYYPYAEKKGDSLLVPQQPFELAPQDFLYTLTTRFYTFLHKIHSFFRKKV